MAEGHDVVFYDRVGGWRRQRTLLAEALAAAGRSVLVLDESRAPRVEHGVSYRHHGAAAATEVRGRALVLWRSSPVPPIAAGKVAVAVTDAPGTAHEHLAPLFAGEIDATLVALSPWHAAQFPAAWHRVAIPPCWPYGLAARAPAAPEHARRFVAPGGPPEGVRATVAAWRELGPAGGELVVCAPGSDEPGLSFRGEPSLEELAALLRASAGLFHVSVVPETFTLAAALAEALGRRAHVLCLAGRAGTDAATRSPLVTSSRETFARDLRAALEAPDDPRFRGEPHDLSAAAIAPLWLELLLDERPLRAPRPRPRVCLNMIVKDEAHVIARCLRSVRPLIDTWLIVDTGSTDGTQEAIRRELADLPGELVERPWRDFAHNRTEAIELARGRAEYLLVVDADDLIAVPPGFALPELTHDAYDLHVSDAGVVYERPHLFRSDHGFRYEGVVHEYLTRGAGPHTSAVLEGPVYRRLGGGGRSRDPDRYRRDAELLARALAARPDDARSAFYLAQSLRDAGELEQALEAYRRRAGMAGWVEEACVALLEVARLSERLGRPEAEIVHAYLLAHERRPARAEALCELARFHRLRDRFALGYLFARAAAELPPPPRALFADPSVYDWRALDELAISAYYCDRKPEALAANRRLLALPGERLPALERARIEKNLALCEEGIRADAGRS
jgi:tetratricopeptide (TPR) repeat protein